MGNCSCGKRKGDAKDKTPRLEGMEEEAVVEAAAKADELQPTAVKAEKEAGKEEGGKADMKKEGTEEKEAKMEETKETAKEETEEAKKEKAKEKEAKKKKAKKEESEKKEAEKGKESKTDETEKAETPKEPGKELKKEDASKDTGNKDVVEKEGEAKEKEMENKTEKKEEPEKEPGELGKEAGKEEEKEEPKALETKSEEVKKDEAEKEQAEKEKLEQELDKKEEAQQEETKKEGTESKEADKAENEEAEKVEPDEKTQRTIVAEAVTPKTEVTQREKAKKKEDTMKEEGKKEEFEKEKEEAAKKEAKKEAAEKEESADERTQRTIMAEAVTPKTEVTQPAKAKKKEKAKKAKKSHSSATSSTGRTQSDEDSSSESLTDLISRSLSENSLHDGKKAPAKSRAKPAEPEKPKQWPMEPWGSTEHTSCVEFRIRLPLSVAEYEKAQIHTVNESSKKVTGSGNGVEVLRNECFGPRTANNAGPLPFGLAGNSGMFTEKVYRLKPLVPAAIRVLLSDDLMTMEERAWNAYPLCKTVITNRKWPKEDCLVLISTNYLSGGDAEVPNALNLPLELLKIRTVHHLDITDDGLIGGRESANYKPAEDPKKLVTWNGRGPFLPGWEKSYLGPQMVIYKVVAVRFRFRFVETRLRGWMMEKTYPNLFTQTHRFAVCSYDVWSRLDMARLREMERETAKQLQEQMKASQGGPAITFQA